MTLQLHLAFNFVPTFERIFVEKQRFSNFGLKVPNIAEFSQLWTIKPTYKNFLLGLFLVSKITTTY